MNDMIDFFMDPLRLTLIIAGVVVLLAIIIFSRKSSKQRDFTYSSPSSKEFSFGSGNGLRKNAISDSMARDMLIDEEIIVLPRKQKESEVAMENRDDANQLSGQPKSNAYNVKVEPKKSKVSEFRAFQNDSVEEQIKIESDVFEDEILSHFKHSPVINNSVDIKQKEQKNTSAQQKIIEETSTKAEMAKKAEMAEMAEKREDKPQSESTEKKPVKETFVVLHVIATEGKPFNGLDILDATKTLGLAFGKHAIFHYPMSAAPAGDSKFCLVNMSTEGNFKTNKISSLETNGVSLIMRLPIRGADSQTVFSNMLGVAQALARKLGGEILDQTRMPLTAEIVDSIRSDIAHFDKSIKLASANSHATKEPVPEI